MRLQKDKRHKQKNSKKWIVKGMRNLNSFRVTATHKDNQYNTERQ